MLQSIVRVSSVVFQAFINKWYKGSMTLPKEASLVSILPVNVSRREIIAAVLVAALGYFVDIYDLILFSVVRVPSLKALNADPSSFYLINLQMAGMLLGGLVFGIASDRYGRLKTLYSSILVYSLANFLNAFVQDVYSYGALRLIAGFGLAGELGAGITLISEILPREKRGWGTTLVVSVGVSGALFAWLVADKLSWRWAFAVGGLMGLSLLLLRLGVRESPLFLKAEKSKNASKRNDTLKDLLPDENAPLKKKKFVEKGDLRHLFFNRNCLFRFLCCIAVGVPTWFVVGILITFSPELSKVFGVSGGEVEAGKAVFYNYAGLVLGDLFGGILSQVLLSRKKSIFISLVLGLLACVAYFLPIPFGFSMTVNRFYGLCFALGIGCGYWAMFVTVSAEQFGTNLRATVATAAPNFVRASVIPLTLLFSMLRNLLSVEISCWILTVGSYSLAFVGLYFLKETFSFDLDFHEAK